MFLDKEFRYFGEIGKVGVLELECGYVFIVFISFFIFIFVMVDEWYIEYFYL